MKLDLSKAVVIYYTEGRTACLGVAMKTGSSYTLYRPVNQELTDWDKITSSKTPLGFSDIIFGRQTKHKSKSEPEAKITKNNTVEDSTEATTVARSKKTTVKSSATSAKKVKKSFL